MSSSHRAPTEPINVTSGSESETDKGEADEEDEEGVAEEDEEAELGTLRGLLQHREISTDGHPERLRKRWTSPVYGFFKHDVAIETIGGRRAHVFLCAKSSCTRKIKRYLDTKDGSTGNMKNHAEACWGEEAVRRGMETGSVDETRKTIVQSILETGRISAYFARGKKKGKVTYSHMQHTKQETRGEITGRPGYYVPSPSTVSCNVKTVFARSRRRIANLLKNYDGKLSFATDAWTSPNHRAFIAITVHLEYEGHPIRLLLDVVEVAKSHSSVNLAAAF
ncbi:hypothetical protein FKP32DRAFT_1585005, partial [Trametes sanguinea]